MLKKMNIRRKLLLDLIPLAVMIVILIALMWTGELNVLKKSRSVYYEQLKETSDKLITADRDFYQAMLAQEKYYMAHKRADTAGENEAKEDYEENAQQVADGLSDIQAILAKDEYLYHTFRGAASAESCEQLIVSSLEKFDAWKVEADRYNTEMAEELFSDARSGLNSLEDVLSEYTSYKDAQLEKSIHKSLSLTILFIAIVLVGLTFLSIYIIRYIRLNIKRIEEALLALSEGRFIQLDASNSHDDEMGNMIRSTNTLIDRLGDIIGKIKKSVDKVNEASADLAETATQISNTTDGISEAVQGIATGAVQQAEEIQTANTNVGSIADSIANVTANTGALAETAGQMENDSHEAVGELGKLRESASEMSERISEIADRINATSTAVEKISEKVSAINSIASQTNLLALNASIEAARAGEAGRGFAVVAEEIGKLADDSAKSANDIRSEMELLLTESQSAVKTAKQVQESNVAQQEVIENTVESIENLIGAIGTTVTGVDSIEQSARETDASKEAVVDAMASLSAISEENAASTEETSASMEELNATVNMLAQSADNLRVYAGEIAEGIAFFE